MLISIFIETFINTIHVICILLFILINFLITRSQYKGSNNVALFIFRVNVFNGVILTRKKQNRVMPF